MNAPAVDPDVFRAVADPTRRAILELLRESDRSASELASPFRMSQPAVSQHLKVLSDAGLIRGRRDGRSRIYHLDSGPLADVYSWAAHYVTDPFGHTWGLSRSHHASKKGKGGRHGDSRR
jgi:DNA-binding transcriptional ArsR family regulator